MGGMKYQVMETTTYYVGYVNSRGEFCPVTETANPMVAGKLAEEYTARNSHTPVPLPESRSIVLRPDYAPPRRTARYFPDDQFA